jgi:acetoin utilization deacetylase AcuC-like enzyme
VYTADHHKHSPHVEFESSVSHSPWENPRRAEQIREALEGDPFFHLAAPTDWGTDPIAAVHDPGLVRFLSTAWADYQQANGPTHDVVADVYFKPGLRDKMSPAREPESINGRIGWWCFETTTPLTETTYEAALGSVNVAMTATDTVLAGATNAYGLCRPPGHHAATSLYGGYCFFNNAAVAAHHVASSTVTLVPVLDVDYHHGNGTQQIFYDRDDVQYVSLHGDPSRAYPYSVGFSDETGSGRGLGANVNVPLAARTNDDQYCSALAAAAERIAAFGPSMLVVSLGVDTFESDPISDLAITTEGFARQGRLVGELGLPTVVLQEGGYDVAAIGANVRAFLRGLAGVSAG